MADTSVLINLCRIGHGDLPRKLFQDVVIPPEVAAEFKRLALAAGKFTGLVLPEGIRQQSFHQLPSLLNSAAGLDPGETAALALAAEMQADAVLLDERRGRQVAAQLGLRSIGILGLLLQGKASGHVPLIRPLLDELRRDAGFWMSDSLCSQTLRLAGETT